MPRFFHFLKFRIDASYNTDILLSNDAFEIIILYFESIRLLTYVIMPIMPKK